MTPNLIERMPLSPVWLRQVDILARTDFMKHIQDEVLRQIAARDTSLFRWIPSSSSWDDRRSLLSLQGALASRRSPYRYLEIGSDQGGSIQPYLLDARCIGIISIDKRSLTQQDERGKTYRYPHNSTHRMLDNLGGISLEQVKKVTTFDTEVANLSPSALPFRPDVCFIDGEHTDKAVLRDFTYCLSILTTPGLIYFHDSNVIFRGLAQILQFLADSGTTFRAYNLPTSIFVIELGGLDLHNEAHIRDLLVDNYRGYLAALNSMAHFRTIANLPAIRQARLAVEAVTRFAARHPARTRSQPRLDGFSR